jgi:hypothetical protein
VAAAERDTAINNLHGSPLRGAELVLEPYQAVVLELTPTRRP